MKFWTRQKARLAVIITMYQHMGILALSPSLQRMWLEHQRLENEVKELEAKAVQASQSLEVKNAQYRLEVTKTFLA